MFETETKNKTMALLVVALFMISAFAVTLAPTMADDEGTDYTNKGFTVNMRAGDTFSYTPRANLDDTRFSWDIPAQKISENDTLTYNETAKTFAQGASITYTPMAAGNITFTLNAVWEKDNLRQTATQTIHIYVLDRIAVSNTENFADTLNITTDSAKTDNLKTYVLSGGNGNAAFSEPKVYTEYDSETGTGVESVGAISAVVDGKSLVLGNNSDPVAGTYTVVTTASYTYGDKFLSTDMSATTASESKKIVITVNVGDGLDLAKKSSSAVIGLQGENASFSSGNPFTIEVINSENITDLGISKGTMDANASTGWASDEKRTGYHNSTDINQDTENIDEETVKLNTATVLLPISGWSNEDISGQSAKMVFDIVLNGNDLEGNPIDTVSIPYTLTVYSSLAFTTTPVNKTVELFASSNNGLDVLLTATVIGAKTLVYDWGDNSPATPVEVIGADNTFVTANHTYSKPGTYFVRITATNDFGDSVFITPYTTGTNFTLDTSDRSITAGEIKATENDGKLTLSANPTITGAGDHSEIVFKWAYKEPGMKSAKAITAADKPSFVESVGNSLVLNKEAVKGGTEFSLTVSTTFEDSTEQTVSQAAKYTYSSGDFFSEHGWLFIIFTILTIIGLILIFYFGYQFPQAYILTAICAILAVALFFCKDFVGIWNALTGLFH